MKSITKTLKAIWNDESGQGTTEYILLAVAIVGVLIIFRDQITTALNQKLDELSGNINSFGN